ncbi:histidine kinase [Candidatus Brocadia pituitae]|nr:histidine kinase [Candidatus Brocadia pituitae]
MTNPARVLIVEDKKASRDILNERVIALGHISIPAENGLSALAQIREQPPDLILLDIMMPEMDGYEVLCHLKDSASWRHIPVIVISAIDDMKSIIRFIEKGADDYLTKPYNPVLLKARIDSCLMKKRLHDQEEQYRHLLEKKVQEKTSDLQKANIALEKAYRLKSEFLATMSHELRTPLNAIIGFAEVLKDELIGHINDEQREYVDDIHSSGKHLLSMINNVLDLSKFEAGKLELKYEEICVKEAIDDVLNTVSGIANKKNISIKNTIQSDIPTLVVDQLKLKQILFNLLSNAIKFTPKNGNVCIDITLKDLYVQFAIADTGIGIKQEDREKIFEAFSQVDSSLARNYEGAGLGLALTKRLVELHGGEIWVESFYGKGSTFTFILPLHPLNHKEMGLHLEKGVVC